MRMEILEAITSRRSIRNYEDKPVPEELIKELLDYAVLSPSGGNMQPWRFAVVQDKELLTAWSKEAKDFMLKKLGDSPLTNKYRTVLESETSLFRNAPALILVFAETKGSVSYVNDCSMAAYNIMLAAHAMGLGSCWIGLFTLKADQPDFKKTLGIPEHYKMIAPITIGYPKGPVQSPPRKKAEIVVWKK